MRIGINALYLLPGKVGGSETYIRNLLRELVAVKGNEYVVFVNKESEGVFDDLIPGIEIVVCPISATRRPVRILWEQFILPIQAALRRIDALLSAGLTAPFLHTMPGFVVIYDMQHLNQPQNFSKTYLYILRAFIYLGAITSDGIITLSEKSKRDIVKYYSVDPDRISVTHMACDTDVYKRSEAKSISEARLKYGLPERYILYIASSLPHKNYQRLLEAFKKVRASKDVKLVLIGARDYGSGAIVAAIDRLEISRDVVLLGWLPFEDIPTVYSGAELFVFPSLHEGFGIPVLEAFSCGVPVVCSDIEPINEVAGNAAVLVDPHSSEDISRGMLAVLNDKGLRSSLVAKGAERVRDFSWKKTAMATLKALAPPAG